MFIQPAPLMITVSALRAGQLDLLEYVEQACNRLERLDPQIQAFLPEPGRYQRLKQQAKALVAKFPDPANRPALYGVLIGVKDIFRADGFPTRAGSQLPPHLFAGAEASCVSKLKALGALILGKTVTAEFAYIEPGLTRNPHNLDHTPGGSSSGSAAAIAVGFCSLAFGTQTIGSVIRPAAYCGVIGFKPGYGRIPTDGIIPVSPSLDHVGLFTQDIGGMSLAASLLCQNWQMLEAMPNEPLPILGVPIGPYLAQASPEGLGAFDSHVTRLEKAGYSVRRISALENIEMITNHAVQLMSAEAADVHADWFSQFEPLYRPLTARLIQNGQIVDQEARLAAQALQKKTQADLQTLMRNSQIDLWISPAATGPAPQGISSTGNSAMNLPWTFAGLPTITLPAGKDVGGLPLGLQCSATFMSDERLLSWSAHLADTLLPINA